MSAKPSVHSQPFTVPNHEPAPHPVPTVPTALSLVVLPQAAMLLFDAAPVFSHASGQVSVTLTARRFLPDGKGGVLEQDTVVGFLRCGLAGAQSLHNALEAAMLLSRPVQGQGRN